MLQPTSLLSKCKNLSRIGVLTTPFRNLLQRYKKNPTYANICGSFLQFLIFSILFYLLALEGVSLLSAEDEDLGVLGDFLDT